MPGGEAGVDTKCPVLSVIMRRGRSRSVMVFESVVLNTKKGRLYDVYQSVGTLKGLRSICGIAPVSEGEGKTKHPVSHRLAQHSIERSNGES